MSPLTVQDGKLLLRDGKLGTEQGCCCGDYRCGELGCQWNWFPWAEQWFFDTSFSCPLPGSPEIIECECSVSEAPEPYAGGARDLTPEEQAAGTIVYDTLLNNGPNVYIVRRCVPVNPFP